MQYQITGDNLPAAIIHLEEGEQLVTESGAMSWMTPNMKMKTQAGGIGKAIGRMFAKEHIFQNIYTAEGGPGIIATASSFPGEIKAVKLSPGHDVVIQKSAFLASETSISLSVFFQKKLGSGLFGGEGFIMQRMSGDGIAFVEIDGSTVEYELEPGEEMIVSTGHVAMMSATCTMDIRTVPGVKNVLFGGEGLFHTVIKGPGKLMLQTMPAINVANALIPYLPKQSN